VISLDSSALLTLMVDEPKTAALSMWLTDRSGIPVSSSELARVEVLRACRRSDPSTLLTAWQLLSSLDFIELSGVVVDMAAELEGATLRSLNAWHLASALSIREAVDAFVAYDVRRNDAASACGLPTAAPDGID
jgi:hypothetical protein